MNEEYEGYIKTVGDTMINKITNAEAIGLDYARIDADVYEFMEKNNMIKEDWLIFSSGSRHEIYGYKVYFKNIEKHKKEYNKSLNMTCSILIFLFVVVISMAIFSK